MARSLPMAAEHASTLASAILRGERAPVDVLNRPAAWEYLNAGANGPLPLLGTSTKIEKGTGAGILTRVLYMLPATTSGRESCAGRSAGCTKVCLVDTGRLGMETASRAMRRRHASFYADRDRFMRGLCHEVRHLAREAARKGMTPAIRLNGTTDLPWERYPIRDESGHEVFPNIMAAFPHVTFYDYTKLALRHRTRNGKIPLPANYHLTFSMSERADADAKAGDYIAAGFSVAVVFAAKKGALPKEWRGVRVIDGDKTDARFTDPAGVYVGLTAKGRAKQDTSGFVRAA